MVHWWIRGGSISLLAGVNVGVDSIQSIWLIPYKHCYERF